MAKAQCLVFLLRHKGLKSFKFGSVHWLKSWTCSFSTGLAQNNRAASWPSTFLLYQPGLDSGCFLLPSWITPFHWAINQSAKQWLFKISLVAQFSLVFAPSPFFPTSCHRFLDIFQTCIPALGFDPPCKMLPQHFNLSWTASTTLNLCDTEAVLPALWRSIANHSTLFHYTFHHEMSNPPPAFFFSNQIIFQCGFMVHFLQTSHTKGWTFTTTLTCSYSIAWIEALMRFHCSIAALQIHPVVPSLNLHSGWPDQAGSTSGGRDWKKNPQEIRWCKRWK